MSVQPIIDHLHTLTELHASLLQLSVQKTELLKDGEMDALRELLNKEQKHVQALNQIEQRRLDAVATWAKQHNLDSTITVSEMIEHHTTGAEREQLERVTLRLAELVVELRHQEDLNRQLTKQSLQFVQLSLDMMQPSMKTINYSNKQTSTSTQTPPKRSVFDSKA